MKALPSTQNLWLNARRKMLDQLKHQIDLRLGPPTPELSRYMAEFERDFGRRRWRASSKKLLLGQMVRADIIYACDFHAFSQSQRIHLRLLREMKSNARPVVLAVEFMEPRHQKDLDQFLKEKISLDELLEKVKWDRRWGFPKEGYAALMQLARERHWPMFGINTSSRRQTLKSRDQFAAQQIARIRKRFPDALIYVIFGELHLAESHLPSRVQTLLKNEREIYVYQDIEKIYFDLARKNLEASLDVVQSRNRFCVFSAPPWVRWQSYEMYLERTYDHDLDEGERKIDYSDHVRTMVSLLSEDFHVKIPVTPIAVYSGRDASVWQVLSRTLSQADFRVARRMMNADRSFYSADGNIFYLSRESINHAADLAGQYVHAQLSSRKQNVWCMPKCFLQLIWVEAFGFFASKMVNHKRAAETLVDLRLQIAKMKTGELDQTRREILALVLEQRLVERLRQARGSRVALSVRPRQKASYLEAARILGSMMGEKFYQAYRLNEISTEAVIDYMKEDLFSRRFKRVYYDLTEKLSTIVIQEKSRSERL